MKTKLSRISKKKPDPICTHCGKPKAIMTPISVWWKSIQVRIQLCDRCIKAKIKYLVDLECDGWRREKLIDSLTQYQQK